MPKKLIWDELTQQFLFIGNNAYPTEVEITREWIKRQELKKYVKGQKTGYWYEVTQEDRDYNFGLYTWEVKEKNPIFVRRIKDAKN